MRLYTIGHSNRTSEAVIALLRGAGVTRLCDVRAYPSSRRNPQFNAGPFADALAEAGIAYHHQEALGGRRGPQALDVPSPNDFWREEAFQNYADYAMGAEFRGGLEALLAIAASGPTAIMCAEADWRQCHRQIIADYLLAAGHELCHIRGPGEDEPAVLSEAAKVQADGRLHYPAAQGTLF